MIENKNTIHYVTSLGAVSGFLLFSIRNQLGLQQNELAKIFNIAQATYGNMERGEAAINVDFIYMLCSIAQIKFSDYFSIIDDIVNEFESPQSFIKDTTAIISLIPSTDFQKVLTDPEAIGNLSSISYTDSNILTGQDFHFFISKETLINIRRLTTVKFEKDDIKKMTKTTVADLEEIENEYLVKDSEKSNLPSAVLMELSAVSVGAFFAITNPLLGGFGLAGYSLYKAHKMSKEAKKTK